MLQEFERAGNLCPIQEHYPPLSVDEEINLQQRIYNFARRNNTKIDLTKVIKYL